MNHLASFPERVQHAFQPTPRGVVGLVDNLLHLCRYQRLKIVFHDDRCFVRQLDIRNRGYPGPSPEANKDDSIDLPFKKAVFRAVLARIAALCNERAPNSVTPYRGEGELSALTDPPALFRAVFTNTPEEQFLEIRYLRECNDDVVTFTVLLRNNRMVTVRGHALRHVQHASRPSDSGSYGVVSRVAGEEILVALFRVSEVTGIFSGEITYEGRVGGNRT